MLTSLNLVHTNHNYKLELESHIQDSRLHLIQGFVTCDSTENGATKGCDRSVLHLRPAVPFFLPAADPHNDKNPLDYPIPTLGSLKNLEVSFPVCVAAKERKEEGTELGTYIVNHLVKRDPEQLVPDNASFSITPQISFLFLILLLGSNQS
ncbi:hypothetical protein L1887_14123 [Cichorium endivia]|nr:hypothetical protein L1887_14123 [Cichorium endivia]